MNPLECEVEGCDEPYRSLGLCEYHYNRGRYIGNLSPDALVGTTRTRRARRARVVGELKMLAGLSDEGLSELAIRLLPHLKAAAPTNDGWISTTDAAGYLGMSRGALHRLIHRGDIPFTQRVPGAKCWFKKSELDTWRSDRAS